MKFGETYSEYLHGNQEHFLHKCAHVEYKRLKKVLKSCRVCRAAAGSEALDGDEEKGGGQLSSCTCNSCSLCDQMFFSELTKEAAEIAGCFSSKVRHLLHPHVSIGLGRCRWRLPHCFADDQQSMAQEAQLLIDYVAMNATAIRKILKKYDKVHCSSNGIHFKTKMQAKHIEPLQSPWLIELGAFHINCGISDDMTFIQSSRKFSFDVDDIQPVMTLTLSESIKLEYSLTCAICLDTFFNPYALSCGHLFCKTCACSAASVLLFQGLKAAPPESKCPICRAGGVYTDSVHMRELNLLLKNRCKKYWKERLRSERAEMVKQSKAFWDSQTNFALGY